MTKYIVSGYIGFDNFGDEAIAHVLVESLKKKGAEKITLISSNPEKTKQIHEVNSCPMLGFFESLKEADILISGGGSLLQDVTSLKSLIYYLGIIYLALFMRKKVIIFSQGIGPLRSKIGKFLTKLALKHCSEISVRDKKSQELLTCWGIVSKLVQDPIFDLDLPVKHNKGIVGIQLRNYPTLKEEFLKSLADEVAKRFADKKIEIFSFQDSIDLEVCGKFKRMLEKNGLKEIEILYGLSINEVFYKIADLEYMIAMRFHANVVAIKSGVKTLAINYDIKVKKLAEEFNLPIIELNQREFSKEFDMLNNFVFDDNKFKYYTQADKAY